MIDAKIRKLAVDIANQRPSTEFSLEDMEETLRATVADLLCNDSGAVDFYKWNDNSPKVFAIMSTMFDEVLPKRVSGVWGQFADIIHTGHGDKPRFILKKGRMNVKRFITKVAAAGVYERVRLDRDYVDIDIYAHGGAIYQTLEGFLAGRESITEILNIFLDHLETTIYEDISLALEGTFDKLPPANKATGTDFDKGEFDKVLNVIRAYGRPVIYCTMAFAANLVPRRGFVSERMKDELNNYGYIGRYLGADVIVLPQSFTDIDNATPVINDGYCYIIPTGSDEKPLKVAFEGNTLIRSVDREDWSTEMQIYKKMGIAVLNVNYYGIVRVGEAYASNGA